jgi:hypothetical protein
VYSWYDPEEVDLATVRCAILLCFLVRPEEVDLTTEPPQVLDGGIDGGVGGMPIAHDEKVIAERGVCGVCGGGGWRDGHTTTTTTTTGDTTGNTTTTTGGAADG